MVRLNMDRTTVTDELVSNTLNVDLTIPTAVAVSGGVDSMSLLHLLAEQARIQQQPLWAFHIHHDLQPQADEWQALVCAVCQNLQVPFATERLDSLSRLPAQSVEEWARQGRYRALSQLAQQHGVQQIVLAHHQDDQIETYLLLKARGAGARGLSAMPTQIQRNGVNWLRPWLNVTRTTIEQYAHEHALAYIDDPSNSDTRYTRNAIRAQLRAKPLNEVQRQTILDAIASAQTEHAQQHAWATQVLQRHSISPRMDIGECGRLRGMDTVFNTAEQTINSESLMILLREWMNSMGWRMPSRAALDELCRQLSKPALNRQICWRHPDGWGVTKLKNDWIAAKLLPAGQWFLTEPLRERIVREQLDVRARMSGERFKLADNRPTIDLKHAYQMFGIAPMLRAQLPLLYQADRLVHVVGVGDVIDMSI